MNCEHKNTRIERWYSLEIEVCEDCDCVRNHDERNADKKVKAETAWHPCDLKAKRKSKKLREEKKAKVGSA